MTWTPDKIKLLQKLWAEGKTAAEIQKQIPDKTRNAIIGKSHRLKLEGRYSPIKKKQPEKPKRPEPHHMTVKAHRRTLERAGINITAFGKPKKLEELKNDECRWPIGDGDLMVFCSGHAPNGVYCDKHRSIAFQGRNQENGDTV